ncbi:MAG: ribosomal protein [Dehalococcoidia bacterium]|nr:ribosomal protein [Dehalococcoidia bacterium]
MTTERQWHVLDASDKVLGRLATEAASLLLGKHKPTFTRNLDMGDYVIVINAARIHMTGKKMTGKKTQQKTYYRHSGYPGGLRSVTAAELMETHPTRVVEKAIKGMLPHTRLGHAMGRKLKVYAGETHLHQAQLAIRATEESAAKEKIKTSASPGKRAVASPVETPVEKGGRS